MENHNTSQTITLQEAIERGEYDPGYLSTFPDWHQLSRHVQFQYIRDALRNRDKQLITQWAEIANILDFSKKPYLTEALRNIEAQRKKLEEDKEFLYAEYSK